MPRKPAQCSTAPSETHCCPLCVGDASQHGNVQALILAVALQCAQGCAGPGVTESQHPVVTATRHQAPVPSQPRAADEADSVVHSAELLPGRRIPDSNGSVCAPANHQVTTAAKRHRVGDSSVPHHCRRQLSAPRIPQADNPIKAAGGHQSSVCRCQCPSAIACASKVACSCAAVVSHSRTLPSVLSLTIRRRLWRRRRPNVCRTGENERPFWLYAVARFACTTLPETAVRFRPYYTPTACRSHRSHPSQRDTWLSVALVRAASPNCPGPAGNAVFEAAPIGLRSAPIQTGVVSRHGRTGSRWRPRASRSRVARCASCAGRRVRSSA